MKMTPKQIAWREQQRNAAQARRERARRLRLQSAHADYMDALRESGLRARPRTRGECVDGPRPCPWVSCRYHLMLDLDPRPTHPPTLHLDPDLWTAGTQTCALDVADGEADAGAGWGRHATLEHIGGLLGVTRERVRQIEAAALKKLEAASGGILKSWRSA